MFTSALLCFTKVATVISKHHDCYRSLKADVTQGIQLVKQLRRLDTPLKQDAEIALYLKEYDEAEVLYRRMDRPDLAIDMRMRLEDWFAVRTPNSCPRTCHAAYSVVQKADA